MKLLVTLGALLFSSVINAAPLHNIVVFGDSLSDNGNLYEIMKHQLPQSPPYYEGRFSNGPVWVEDLIASYFPNAPEEHLLDYAVGGSGVSEEDEDDVLFTLKKQVNNFLLSHEDKADPNDLYVVWIGANNYLALPEDPDRIIDDVNKGIFNSVQKLIDKGAKHVLLITLPDLGKTPAAVEFNQPEQMSYLSSRHNEQLHKSFNELKQNNPRVDWFYFDLAAVFADVVNHKELYGFSNVTDTCSTLVDDETKKQSLFKMVARVKPSVTNNACADYLFFDLVHPTAFAHKLIADQVRLMLNDSGVVFSD